MPYKDKQKAREVGRKATRKWNAEHPEYKRNYSSTIRGHCKSIYHAILRRKHVVTIDEAYLVDLFLKQDGNCAVTGLAMNTQKGAGIRFTSPSLDRIDNTKGYEPGNVRWVCYAVNTMKGKMTDQELRDWAQKIVTGTESKIPNYNTVADAIDRLIVEVLKLSWYENAKRTEQDKSNPDFALVAKWDKLSRDACEYRDMLKREIDRLLSTISNHYTVLPAFRTFSSPKKTVAELIAERTLLAGSETFRAELAEALESDLA